MRISEYRIEAVLKKFTLVSITDPKTTSSAEYSHLHKSSQTEHVHAVINVLYCYYL
jgi:hypothetical protein